ncbi:MAG: hypothetical protein E6I72_08055 [Chloroflexi bacterium]|nr:MAG: hypothetical protein E6I72_08055 [Chloroflexota bacterium]
MNDFDRFLELQLRNMLDPVAATPPPDRRGRHERAPILAVEPPIGFVPMGIVPRGVVADVIPASEPLPVTVAVAPLPQP